MHLARQLRTLVLGAPDAPGDRVEDASVEDADQRGHDVGSGREEADELGGWRQDVLAHRNVRQDAFDEVTCEVFLPPSAAARAHATAFAGHGKRPLQATVGARHPHEAPLRDSALEVALEGGAHELGQRTVGFVEGGDELRPPLLHEWIQRAGSGVAGNVGDGRRRGHRRGHRQRRAIAVRPVHRGPTPAPALSARARGRSSGWISDQALTEIVKWALGERSLRGAETIERHLPEQVDDGSVHSLGV